MDILANYQGLIVDLDGVVFRGVEAVRGAPSFIRRLVKQDHPVVFVTNDSRRSPGEWSARFEEHRMAIPPERIITSATATADLLGGTPPARCFVIGEFGLTSALRAAGAEVLDRPDDADTVVVGLDRRLSYDKLRHAVQAIRRGARFVGTNPDVVVPGPDDEWPGNGATLAYIRAATGVAPEVVGKPMPPMLELAVQRLGIEDGLLVVGDQIGTDIVGADRVGLDSALVLTGVSSWRSLVGAEAQPTWVVETLADLDGPAPAFVRPAKEADLSAIRRLLEDAGLDTTGAAARWRETLVAEDPAGEVVGTISWEMVGTAAHLRGITVDQRERGHGTGTHLVVSALDVLQRAGVELVYLLTPGADELFLSVGFWRVQRDRVPEEILETAQFGDPAAGGTAFVRRLRDGERRPITSA